MPSLQPFLYFFIPLRVNRKGQDWRDGLSMSMDFWRMETASDNVWLLGLCPWKNGLRRLGTESPGEDEVDCSAQGPEWGENYLLNEEAQIPLYDGPFVLRPFSTFWASQIMGRVFAFLLKNVSERNILSSKILEIADDCYKLLSWMKSLRVVVENIASQSPVYLDTGMLLLSTNHNEKAPFCWVWVEADVAKSQRGGLGVISSEFGWVLEPRAIVEKGSWMGLKCLRYVIYYGSASLSFSEHLKKTTVYK